jgi:hypothetical protein
VQFVEIPAGGDLRAALAGTDAATLVCAGPPGTRLLDAQRVVVAYEQVGGRIVLAASPVPTGAAPPVAAPTPYRYVAPAAIGPAAALCELGAVDPDAWAAAFVAGADLELDIGAEIFLVRDGTGTDALVVGDDVIATATGTRPAVIIGDDVAAPVEKRDDLALLYAYDDAAVAPGEPTIEAAEIVRVRFWSRSVCDAVIRAAEAAAAWDSDPDDPVPGCEISLAALNPRLFGHVTQQVETLVWPALQTIWPKIAWNGVHDAFVIKYAAGTGDDALRLHHDVAQLSASVRLNDGYVGGALRFPRQAWDNHAVPVGDLIAWPSLVTHPHAAAPVTRGVKYGLTIWLSLPG